MGPDMFIDEPAMRMGDTINRSEITHVEEGAAFMETEALKNRHDWKTGRREEVLKQTPLARIATPEDMVGPTLFLAADDSRHMTGQFLLCNGGLAMVGA